MSSFCIFSIHFFSNETNQRFVMNIEDLREYCLKKKEVTESFPFDDTTLVFKVKNKIFALTDIEKPLIINLKCDPEEAIELRERYTAVKPGYHMNKKLWNTIDIDGSIDEELILKWIDDSYRLIVEKLPKKDRETLL